MGRLAKVSLLKLQELHSFINFIPTSFQPITSSTSLHIHCLLLTQNPYHHPKNLQSTWKQM